MAMTAACLRALSSAAFERFWDALVRRVRSRAAGDVDMAEVNRLFGWDKAA